jgi:hypothetical protein
MLRLGLLRSVMSISPVPSRGLCENSTSARCASQLCLVILRQTDAALETVPHRRVAGYVSAYHIDTVKLSPEAYGKLAILT